MKIVPRATSGRSAGHALVSDVEMPRYSLQWSEPRRAVCRVLRIGGVQRRSRMVPWRSRDGVLTGPGSEAVSVRRVDWPAVVFGVDSEQEVLVPTLLPSRSSQPALCASAARCPHIRQCCHSLGVGCEKQGGAFLFYPSPRDLLVSTPDRTKSRLFDGGCTAAGPSGYNLRGGSANLISYLLPSPFGGFCSLPSSPLQVEYRRPRSRGEPMTSC
jgi:hypothetical protein